MLIAIANGRQYGNRVCIAPGAKLDDGLLEVVIVEQLSIAHIAARLPSLFRGGCGRAAASRCAPSASCGVSAAGAIPFHVDGEPRVGPAELAVVVHQHALSVKTPADLSG